MNANEIKAKIDSNNERIRDELNASFFVLNDTINALLAENEALRAECPHRFEDGVCAYCGEFEVKE